MALFLIHEHSNSTDNYHVTGDVDAYITRCKEIMMECRNVFNIEYYRAVYKGHIDDETLDEYVDGIINNYNGEDKTIKLPNNEYYVFTCLNYSDEEQSGDRV